MKRFYSVGTVLYDGETPILKSKPQTIKYLGAYLNKIYNDNINCQEMYKNAILGQINDLIVSITKKDYDGVVLNTKKLKKIVERG